MASDMFYRPADDATGLYAGKPETQEWREAIAKYDADVASGVIKFGPNGFADEYPGKEKHSVADWLGNYASYLNGFPNTPPIREINP